jgi:phosphohistidine swiveling domain-containing protein
MIIDNDIYIDLNEVDKVKQMLSEDVLAKATDTYQVIENQSKKLLQTAKESVEDSPANLTNSELSDKIARFLSELQATVGMIGIPTVIDIALEEQLRLGFKESGIENIDETLAHLATPDKTIDTLQEHSDLLSIAQLAEDRGMDSSIVRDRANDHAKQYGWLHSTLFLGELYTSEKVIEEIEKYLGRSQVELDKLETKRKEQKAKAEQVINQLSSEQVKREARLLQTAVYYRTARLEWMNEACYIARPLLKEAANRLSLSFDNLIYLLPHELTEALTGQCPINHEDIRQRQSGYALISDDSQKYALYTGEQLNELKQSFDRQETVETLTGLVASKGTVKGKVVIVKDRSEFHKVEHGDVLVTRLTTPDFVVAMKKAVAIITDLGGLTSHAAIVSRELNIPCIVGTKFATSHLADGDIVEVDAINGLIKKVGKS